MSDTGDTIDDPPAEGAPAEPLLEPAPAADLPVLDNEQIAALLATTSEGLAILFAHLAKRLRGER